MAVPQPLDDFLPTNVGLLRKRLLAILQTTVAAGAAWELAVLAPIGTSTPIYTTLAIVTGMNVHPGQRGKWMLQVVLGAILGVLLANAIGYTQGPDAADVTVGVFAALAVGILFYSQNWFLINVAAGMVITVASGSGAQGFDFTVGWQALIAGGVALVFTQLLFPANAKAMLEDDVRQVLQGAAETLRRVARELHGDEPDDEEALARSKSLDDQLSQLDQHRRQARQIVRFAPLRRLQADDVERLSAGVDPLKVAVDDLAALSHLVRRRAEVLAPAPQLASACDELADVLGDLADRPTSRRVEERARTRAEHVAGLAAGNGRRDTVDTLTHLVALDVAAFSQAVQTAR